MKAQVVLIAVIVFGFISAYLVRTTVRTQQSKYEKNESVEITVKDESRWEAEEIAKIKGGTFSTTLFILKDKETGEEYLYHYGGICRLVKRGLLKEGL